MSCNYCVRQDEVSDESGRKYLVYGIDVLNNDGRVLKSIPDVFFDRNEAENFVELCNKKQLDQIHLEDVVMDIIVCL